MRTIDTYKEYQCANILIIDKDRDILKPYKKSLEKLGYNVYQTITGKDALSACKNYSPDIILLASDLPNQDGYKLIEELKRNHKSIKNIPILFIIPEGEICNVDKILKDGGNDYICKPFCQQELINRINVYLENKMLREKFSFEVESKKQTEQALQRATRALMYANQELNVSHNDLINEQYIAKEIFDNIAHQGDLDDERINCLASPFSIFNGDVLLALKQNKNVYHMMLGDFTGHGLPAAIGVMPTADIFYSMTRKGFNIDKIIRECNVKLKGILPIGMFCAATFLRIDFAKLNCSIWGGGATEVIHTDKNGNVKGIINAENLALGILGDSDFDIELTTIQLDLEDRIYIYSDGVIESKNQEQEMFGVERLISVLTCGLKGKPLLEHVADKLKEFSGAKSEQDDDITIMEINTLA